ncbi:conjugal transfer protein TraH [Sulfuricystis multivorans]|uniref:conjugal transfer protein TraH n=1 Tax=Sulfuricystis multivorans TaxID=2211108 RepID=UPI000F834642|nr:conjugal transfer protein TraH [Sulfuricystis multivorans]
MFKKRIIAGLMGITFTITANASVYSEMQSWFDEIGVYGNITGPQAIKGQTGTTFTGGSLFMRTPVRNYQLFAFQPPTVRAGCGGIDLHAGSFSFINSEAFTALLRNIGNVAIGAAFMMAVESVSPELAGILKSLQQFAQAANAMNINSCEAGQALANLAVDSVKGMMSKENSAGRSEAARTTNIFTDALDAGTKFLNDLNAKKNAMMAMKNADPGMKDLLESKNVAWMALRKLNVSQDMIELMMSLTGTVILLDSTKTQSGRAEVIEKPATISYAQLVGKPDQAATPVKIYWCMDNDTSLNGCLSVDQVDTTLYSFYYRVRKLLEDGRFAVLSRSNVNFSDNVDKAIYANSTTPLWKIVASSAVNGSVATHDDLYAEVVAAQLAYAYIAEIARETNKGLASNKGSLDEQAVAATRKLMDNVKDLLTMSQNEYSVVLRKAQAVSKQQENIQWFVSTMYNALRAAGLTEKLAFNTAGK